MNLFRFAFLWVILSVAAGKVAGQKTYTRTDIREMFPVNTKNVWIVQLRGKLDGIHRLDMLLGTDGHTTRGLYTMKESGETFFVEGKEINQQLQLVEMNGDQRLSGFIFGKYDGKSFEGKWMNASRTDSLPLALTFVGNYSLEEPVRISTFHWHRVYSGLLEGKKVKLYLHKEGEEFTCAHYENGMRHEQQTRGNGSRAEFLAFPFSDCALAGKWIGIDTVSLDKIDIILPTSEGYDVVATLKQESALEFINYEFADYHNRLVCLRPVSANKSFSSWMDQVLKQWVDQHLQIMISGGAERGGTTDRWVHFAEGWVEVDLFLPQLVSGTIYLQSSLESHTEKIPFIYDLKNNRLVSVEELFQDKVLGQTHLRKLVEEKILQTMWQPLETKWVQNQDFSYYTLSDDGLCCRSEFNAIFGEKTIIIPYEDLRTLLRENSVLKTIMGN